MKNPLPMALESFNYSLKKRMKMLMKVSFLKN
jgi:hypothetical protein